MRHAVLLAPIAIVLVTGDVHAQPASGDKTDAKTLLASGLKLFAAKDYLGALVVFRDAYERFPSGRILLNIGTTLVKLDRKAEAANAYQGYLDATDIDAAKKPAVAKVLAELDREVGLLEVTVEPGDAEVQIGEADAPWLAAAAARAYRVGAGAVTVRARRAGHVPGEQQVTVAAGARKVVAVALAVEPVTPPPTTAAPVETGVRVVAPAAEARSRLGVLALAHVDVANQGGAARLGVTFDLTSRLQAQGAALLGPSSGAYLGATFAVLPGRVRPLLAAGVPLFISDGARVAIRGAGGVELVINRHLAVIAELGVEHVFNPETDVASATLLIPAIGASGRL